MWSDNESDLDFLGFRHLVDGVVGLVKNDSLLPATIGLYGDWGSGKSSLLQMVKNSLELDDSVLVIQFNGWVFEGYDDAKVALMAAILDQLKEHKKLLPQAKELIVRLFRRIDLIRVTSLITKGAVAYSTAGKAGVGIVAGLELGQLLADIGEKAKEIKQDEVDAFFREKPEENVRRGIRDFRKDFAELLERTDIARVVVLIDDLDRCLPDTIIETLEAIKLFLFVPKTAFILAADERLVRYAVRRRFPELPGERAEVGRDYLEKLVQFPVRIPPLGRAELETYVNLLFAKNAGLTPGDFEKARDFAVNFPAESLLDVRFNYGIAEKLFKTVSPGLADGLSLAQRISPVLASGLRGNPRQCKRFLNTLMMRISMAKSRGIDLGQRILAKLMLLEYFQPESFKQLAVAQVEENGKPKNLAAAEKLAQEMKAEKGVSEKADEDLPSWIADPSAREWLRSEPSLANVDLRPYFFFSRDLLGPIAGSAQRLSPAGQECLVGILHDSAAIRANSLKKAKDLSPIEATAVFEALAEKTRQEEDLGKENSSLYMLVEWVRTHRTLVGQLLTLVVTLPEPSLPLPIALKLVSLCDETGQKDLLRPILEKWARSTSNSKLKTASSQALSGKLKPKASG